MAKAIKNKNNIQYLAIKNNRVKDEGAIALAGVLKENKSLIGLDLMFNEIGDIGAEYLAGAIEINTTLKILKLSNNIITDQGGICIAKSLEKNSTLQQIYFWSKFGDKVAEEFISALAINRSLTGLEINAPGWFISLNLLLKINEICVRNKSFCEHYEKVLPEMVDNTLSFFCKVPKDLSKIVTEYCEGEYPRYQ